MNVRAGPVALVLAVCLWLSCSSSVQAGFLPCLQDGDCYVKQWCNTTQQMCQPVLPTNSQSYRCTRDRMCDGYHSARCLVNNYTGSSQCIQTDVFCSSDAQCHSWEYCNIGERSKPYCVWDKYNNDKCKRNAECYSNLCSGGKCINVNSQIKCTQANAAAVCGAGLYCDGTTGVCVPTFPDNTPCLYDRQCSSGRCSGTTMPSVAPSASGVCLPQVNAMRSPPPPPPPTPSSNIGNNWIATGVACRTFGNNAACGAYAFCTGTACVLKLNPGTACLSNYQCISEKCIGYCAMRMTGEGCSSNIQCLSLKCNPDTGLCL